MVQKPHSQNGTKFVYRVEIGSVVATAPGQSKKKAKHAAALTALQSLLRQVEDQTASRYLASVLTPAGDATDEKQENLLSDSDMNSVGKLQELCMKKRWRPPSYHTFEEIGAPHERMFRMVCEVNCDGTVIRSEGTARSKKLAKRSAAIRMMDELEAQHLLPAGHNSHSQSTASHTPGHREDPDAREQISSDLWSGKQANAYDKLVAFMKGIGDDLNQELDPLLESADAHESLSTISDFLECRAEYHSLPSNTSDMEVAVVHLQPIDKFQTPIPIASGWGVGVTEHEARTSAARRLLLNLRTIRYID